MTNLFNCRAHIHAYYRRLGDIRRLLLGGALGRIQDTDQAFVSKQPGFDAEAEFTSSALTCRLGKRTIVEGARKPKGRSLADVFFWVLAKALAHGCLRIVI